MKLNKNIARYIDDRCISLSEISRKTHISQMRLVNAIYADEENLEVHEYIKISRVLGVDIKKFLKEG